MGKRSRRVLLGGHDVTSSVTDCRMTEWTEKRYGDLGEVDGLRHREIRLDMANNPILYELMGKSFPIDIEWDDLSVKGHWMIAGGLDLVAYEVSILLKPSRP